MKKGKIINTSELRECVFYYRNKAQTIYRDTNMKRFADMTTQYK